MTLTLATVLNVIPEVSIVAAVAYVMTRAGRLAPHGAAAGRERTVAPEHRGHRFGREAVGGELEPALD